MIEGCSFVSFVYEGGKNDYINWRKVVIYFQYWLKGNRENLYNLLNVVNSTLKYFECVVLKRKSQLQLNGCENFY